MMSARLLAPRLRTAASSATSGAPAKKRVATKSAVAADAVKPRAPRNAVAAAVAARTKLSTETLENAVPAASQEAPTPDSEPKKKKTTEVAWPQTPAPLKDTSKVRLSKALNKLAKCSPRALSAASAATIAEVESGAEATSKETHVLDSNLRVFSAESLMGPLRDLSTLDETFAPVRPPLSAGALASFVESSKDM